MTGGARSADSGPLFPLLLVLALPSALLSFLSGDNFGGGVISDMEEERSVVETARYVAHIEDNAAVGDRWVDKRRRAGYQHTRIVGEAVVAIDDGRGYIFVPLRIPLPTTDAGDGAGAGTGMRAGFRVGVGAGTSVSSCKGGVSRRRARAVLRTYKEEELSHRYRRCQKRPAWVSYECDFWRFKILKCEGRAGKVGPRAKKRAHL
ncbi:hypothetical protein DFH06DRAFT_1153420 [Mycena polygramma]|nr:hypothetical protein DFH06DRAFT_1153420 [Mycena polygramma]